MSSRAKSLKGSSVEESAASALQPFNPSTVEFSNRQRTKRINSGKLREITGATLAELSITGWNLCFHFVSAKTMAQLNQKHLDHEGPTDVITFDYSEHSTPTTQHVLHGEAFICIDVAVTQAREFGTTWQSEVVRYLVHALLHLCGHDDLQADARREMKRHENRLVKKLARRFSFAAL